MSIRIGIIENKNQEEESLHQMLTEFGYNAIPPVNNYNDALSIINKFNPDLLIIDLELYDIRQSILFAKKINKSFQIPFIFYTTGLDLQSLKKIISVNPSGYLLKPFRKEDIYSSIEIAFNNLRLMEGNGKVRRVEKLSKEYLFIKDKDSFHKVKFEDILYLKSNHVYIQVISKEKVFLVRSSLNNYLLKLDATFQRIHRSYAVNIRKITSFNSKKLILGQVEIPIGKEFRDNLIKTLQSEQ